MSGASEKARFYLEQSIPELKELQKQKLFSKDEIMSIARKRSDFEHKLNGRGSSPLDYARYLEFEMNLESLRLKRAKRLGSKGGASHAAQRRQLFIMDRATRKFYGDLELWTQYFELARRQKALKKASQILTSMVRLHPAKPDVWTYAARYAADDQGDMTEARSFMQRGLRFCNQSRQLWLEYARLELEYIAKLASRRRILGLDQNRQSTEISEVDDPNADMLALPTITAEDIDPSLRKDDGEDQNALATLHNTPALTGAIPKAIFDSAMRQFNDVELGARFFDLTFKISGLSCAQIVAQHFVDSMSQIDPKHASTLDVMVRLPLVGVDPSTADFPRALGPALSQLKEFMNENPSSALAIATINWTVSYMQIPDLDQDIRKVFANIVARTVSQYTNLVNDRSSGGPNEALSILDKVRVAQNSGLEAGYGNWMLKRWPADENVAKAIGSTSRELATAQ